MQIITLWALALAGFCFSLAAQEGSLRLFWIDVEGGAATLLVTPAGESVLVDTGNPGGRDSKRIHEVATKTAGLKQIDHLVTSHFHGDHFGGAAELSTLMPIVNVYDNGIPEKDPDGRNDERFAGAIKPYREMKVAKRIVIKPGDSIPLRAAGERMVQLRCLATMQQSIGKPQSGSSIQNPLCQVGTEKAKDTSDNANSIVLHLRYGTFDFFNGGDLTWNTEATLVCPINLVGPIDVYQVNHHGMDVSNNPILVRSLAPTVSVMANGVTKGCGPETFTTLKNIPTIQAMYQMHKNLREDSQHNTADEMIANLEKDCAANFIQITVAPDARSYSVAIPARGHSRTFQTR